MLTWQPPFSRGMRSTVASAPHVRVGVTITVLALAGILIATLRPDSNPPLPSHWCLICGTQGGVDAILNVLLFLPLGVGLALTGFSWRGTTVCALVTSVLVELAQLAVIAGRDATIGDVITNTLGGAVGFAVATFWVVLTRPSRNVA